MIRSINLFAEDSAHEIFISALLKRFSDDYAIEAILRPFSVRGGYGKAITELRQYIRDVRVHRLVRADLLIVAIDANCKGYIERKREIDRVTEESGERIVCAIPDPHIERWLLLDSSAFKQALGKGCQAPDLKCDRDRYKKLLLQAVVEANITPLLGGVEHAAAIVDAMDLQRMEVVDNSLGKLLQELRTEFKQWQS
ncbi:DUF4276 family protein [Gloeobacter violaceus]|uniref:DUF4276 family protein n=1 Tax=Gloeobacter violaceus TaxID=33072 RepID=UPI0013E8F49A|nr:DUF4276 family protein [Gloeobacter violaceus]